MALRRYTVIALLLFLNLLLVPGYSFAQYDNVELAKEYYQKGDLWKALGLLEKELNSYGGNDEARSLITRILHDLMDNDIKTENSVEGEYFLAKLKKYNPSDPSIDYYDGVFSAIDGNYQRAINLLKKYLGKDEYPAAEKYYYSSLINHAKELLSTNSFREALPFLLEYTSKKKDDPEALFLIGKYYFAVGDYEKAQNFFGKLLKFENYKNKALYYLGMCYFKMGEYEKGINLVEKSYRLFPTQQKGTTLYDYFKEYTRILLQHNKFKDVVRVTRRWEKDFGGGVDPLFFRGIAFFRLGEYGKAEKLFLKVLKSNPNYPNINKWLGRVYLQLGLVRKKARQFREAKKLFEKAYFFDEHQGEAYFHAGEIYFWEKNYKNAIPLLTLALREKTEEKKSLYYLGKIYYDKQQFRKAITYLEKLYKRFGNYKDTSFLLSRSYYQLALNEFDKKRFTPASVFALQSYNYDRSFLPAWYIIGASYFYLKSYQDASGWLKKVVDKKEDYRDARELLSESYFNIGYSLFENGKYTEAIDYFRKSIRLTPDKLKSIYFLGIALSNTERYKEAIRELKIVYDKKPTFLKVSWWLGETYYRWGEKNYRLNNYKGAINLLKLSIKYDPTKKEALYLLGFIYYKFKNYAEADRYLQKAYDVDPSYRDVATLLRNTLVTLSDQSVKKGMTDRAIEYLRRALGIFPRDGEANYKLATLLYGKGNLKEAFDHYRIAADVNYNRLNSQYMMGKISVQLGWWDRAIELLTKVRESKPGYRDTASLLERAYYNAGKELFSAGNYARAVSYLTEAYRLLPRKLETIYMLGVSYFNLEQYTQSVNFLEELRRKNKGKPYKQSDYYLTESYVKIAEGYLETGKYQLANETALSGLRISPKDKRLNYIAGVSFLKLGKYTKAIDHLKKVEQIDPRFRDLRHQLYMAYKKRGYQFAGSGNLERAISDLETSLKYNDRDSEVYIKIAQLYHEKRDIRKSIETLNRLMGIDPKNTEGLYLLGLYYRESGNLKSAIDSFERLYGIDPTYRDVKELLFKTRVEYGKKLYAGNRLSEALRNFKRAVELYPEDKEAHFLLGKTYYYLGKLQQALDVWRKLEKLGYGKGEFKQLYSETLRKIVTNSWHKMSPKKLVDLLEERKKISDDDWNRYHLGFLYGKLEQFTRAIDELTHLTDEKISSPLIKDSPGTILGRAYLGRALKFRKEEKWKKEITDLFNAQKLIKDTEILFYLGEAYYKIHQFDEAERFLREYIDSSARNREAYFILGMIMKEKGKLAEAYDLFVKFIQSGGDRSRVRGMMREIAKQLASEYYNRKQYKKAIEWLKRALQLKYVPADEVWLGKMYYFAGDTETTTNILERDLPYLDDEAKMILHRIYQKKGQDSLKNEDYPLARTYLEKAMFYFAGDMETLQDLIIARYNLKDYDGVIKLYEANQNKSFSKEVRDLIFQSLMIRATDLIDRDPSRAAHLLEMAGKIKMTPAVKYYLARAMYKLGKYKESLDTLMSIEEEGIYLTRAEKFIPEVKSRLALSYLKTGKCDDALKLLLSVQDKFSGRDDYEYYLARAYYCKGEYNRAYDIMWTLYNKKKKVEYYRFLIKIREKLR